MNIHIKKVKKPKHAIERLRVDNGMASKCSLTWTVRDAKDYILEDCLGVEKAYQVNRRGCEVVDFHADLLPSDLMQIAKHDAHKRVILCGGV